LVISELLPVLKDKRSFDPSMTSVSFSEEQKEQKKEKNKQKILKRQ
jgi:hypothetical protein